MPPGGCLCGWQRGTGVSPGLRDGNRCYSERRCYGDQPGCFSVDRWHPAVSTASDLGTALKLWSKNRWSVHQPSLGVSLFLDPFRDTCFPPSSEDRSRCMRTSVGSWLMSEDWSFQVCWESWCQTVTFEGHLGTPWWEGKVRTRSLPAILTPVLCWCSGVTVLVLGELCPVR